MNEAAVAPGLGKEWPDVSPHSAEYGLAAREQEHAVARRDGAKSGQGGTDGAGGRLVGAQSLDDGEVEGELLPGEAGRSADYCAS